MSITALLDEVQGRERLDPFLGHLPILGLEAYVQRAGMGDEIRRKKA